MDFAIETAKRTRSAKPRLVCIEVKLAKRWQRRWEKAMRSLAEGGSVAVERMFGVYTGRDRYHFDGVDVVPVGDFLAMLHGGEAF